MAAYNSVNGEWAGQNRILLTDVLRDQWGWDGITATDFIWGMRDGAAALEAGLDLEEPFAQQRATSLRNQIEAGETSWASVERAAVRILATQLRSYESRTSTTPSPEVMASDAHRALARRAAASSMVLLRNEAVDGAPLLPLGDDIASIALIGRLVDQANIGDHGSSEVRPPTTVSPLDRIRAAYPDARITVVTDDDVAAASAAAADADLAIVVAGYTSAEEGEYIGQDTMTNPDLLALFPPMPDEFDLFGIDPAAVAEGQPFASDEPVPMVMSDGMGGDRSSLRLRPIDEAIISAVGAANRRTVVSIVAAGAVVTEAWRHQVPAVLVQWYAGMEGGHALADVLSGRHNPSGRLPFSIPTSEEHLPHFDRDATSITYDRFHGQRLLDRLGVDAAYPHGFGLSYTTYAITGAALVGSDADGPVVSATVRNDGDRDGRHVVQVYGRRSTGAYAGELLLVGFGVVDVAAGGFANVTIDVSLTALAEWDPTTRRRIAPDPGDVVLEIGSHAHDPAAFRLGLTTP